MKSKYQYFYNQKLERIQCHCDCDHAQVPIIPDFVDN